MKKQSMQLRSQLLQIINHSGFNVPLCKCFFHIKAFGKLGSIANHTEAWSLKAKGKSIQLKYKSQCQTEECFLSNLEHDMALKKKQKRKNHLKHPKRHHFATSFVKWIFRYRHHSEISSGSLTSTVRVISIFNLFHKWHLFMFWKKNFCSSDYQNYYCYNKCIAAKNNMHNHEQNPILHSNSQRQREP